jgi:hypothetical protein
MTDPVPLSRSGLRVAIAGAAFGLCLWRISAALRLPQLWAEDGAVFFAEAAADPAHGLGVVLAPYAGYFHLIPRLIAVMGSFLPALPVPLFYALAASFCLGVTAWVVQSPRIRLPGAGLAALALAAIPHTGEVYGTICNIQWVTSLGLFAILLAEDASTAWQRRLDVAGVVVTGLTGPFVVLVAPLFILRAVARKSRWSRVLAGVALAAALIQAASLCSHPGDAEANPRWKFLNLFGVMGRRLFVSLFAGQVVIGVSQAIAILFIALGALGFVFWRWREKLPGGLVLLTAGLLVLVAATVKIRFDQMPFGDFNDGDRYFFTDKVILVWLLAAIAGRWPFVGRPVLILVLGCALLVNRHRFVFATQPDLDWPKYAAALDRGEGVRVPILPKDFYLWVPPRRMAP